MILECWIYATPSAWAAIEPQDGQSKQAWHYAYTNKAKWDWKMYQSVYKVYSVTAGKGVIDELLQALETAEPGSVAAVDSWFQGPGVGNYKQDEFPADPTRILSVMQDHVTYDQDGNPTGTEPATLDNPNWGCKFYGQGRKYFARQHDGDHDGDHF